MSRIDQPALLWTSGGLTAMRTWVKGIQYTDTERAQMLDSLADQIELAVRRRAMKLPNWLPPATVFDQRLPGFTMPAQSRMNIPRIAPPLPANDEDIAFAPVSHQSAWIAGGQLTSVRLTRIYLDRVHRHDPTLLSFTTVTEALALAQAENAVPSHSQTGSPKLMLR